MKKIIFNFIIFTIVTSTISCVVVNVPQELQQNKDNIQPRTNNKRFFSKTSFWNTAIPEHPEIDPQNDEWIKMLEQEPTGENFGITYKKWTIPIYESDNETPLYHIKNHTLSDKEKTIWNTVVDRKLFGHGHGFNPVPIPDQAQPDPERDSHLAVVDWDRMLAWDMWGFKKLPDGSWESKTGMVTRLDGDGVFDSHEIGCVDKESVHFHGPSRASGVPAYAGVIMYDEVMSGHIKHRLACATRYAAYRTYVYPASWTDGTTEGGIPEGAVIQLDPKLDLSSYGLTTEEKVIAKALQEYGAVIVDVARGQPIYAEGLWGHPDKSWENKLREWDGGINDIPYKHYRILKVENSVKKGDTRIKNLKNQNNYWSE